MKFSTWMFKCQLNLRRIHVIMFTMIILNEWAKWDNFTKTDVLTQILYINNNFELWYHAQDFNWDWHVNHNGTEGWNCFLWAQVIYIWLVWNSNINTRLRAMVIWIRLITWYNWYMPNELGPCSIIMYIL